MEQEWLMHNSHALEYRRPFGPVICGSKLFIAIKVSALRKIDGIFLRLWQEESGEQIIAMQPADIQSGDWRYYQVEIKARSTPGLMWYWFFLRDSDTTWYYGTKEDGLGGAGQTGNTPPPAYQITVYPADSATPAWFKETVVYQIFVDRFANGREDGSILHPKPEILAHQHWDDTPVYAKDPDTGQVLAYDFFGGNLAGVIKKLPYLTDLGITAIYFNPIFEAPSNHKYDTADYKQIDSMLGDNDLFQELCHQAAERGISIILDGVFSHTGSDSIYFNKENRYPEIGAYQSKQSPYYSWYLFINHPKEYESWWGVDALPNVNELDPGYLQFVIKGTDSVLRYWNKIGVRGWRLDVADELPEEFIRIFRQELKSCDPENILIGEVWEDASRKESYGKMRSYFHGDELDSVINYPWRKILLNFVLGMTSADQAARALLSQFENYPIINFFSNFNVLGTHDVPRILTLAGEAPSEKALSLAERGRFRLEGDKLQLALQRLQLLALCQMTFPGAPCIYYGDEAGTEGYSDPLNRRTYPWGNENKELLTWYKKLIAVRNAYPMLRTGKWEVIWAEGDVLAYRRWINAGCDALGQSRPNNMAIVIINRGSRSAVADIAAQDWDFVRFADVLNHDQPVRVQSGRLKIEIPSLSGKLFVADITQTVQERHAGILLHLTSLPGSHGCGDLGACSYRFIDFLVLAKQKYWQILPFNPRGDGDSPYQSCSAFAGDPLLIALNPLIEEKLLTAEEVNKAVCRSAPSAADRVLSLNVKKLKEPLFRLAFKRYLDNGDTALFQAFQQENQYWLKDYTLFTVLAAHFATDDWTLWEMPVMRREKSALDYFREIYQEEIEYQAFLQYLFDKQWMALKQYAAASGIKIIGDLPIFVAQNSSDVWANQELFKLDENKKPAVVAGVPPDYFSPDGQRWGNPLYNWTAMGADNYNWWQERFQHLLKKVDSIRLDHFRGFAAFWEIPASEATAVHGQWVPGPAEEFFLAMQAACGSLPVIAEDLGHITADVHALKDRFGFPGMQVLQFSFIPDGAGNCYPIRISENCVVYTGTHDNDTTVGWYDKLGIDNPEQQACVRRYLGTGEDASPQTVCRSLVERAYQSRAKLVIIPLQDILGLDSAARMNIPGTATGNWQWRCKSEDLSSIVAFGVAPMVEASRR